MTTRAQTKCCMSGITLSLDQIITVEGRIVYERLLRAWIAAYGPSTMPDGSPLTWNEPVTPTPSNVAHTLLMMAGSSLKNRQMAFVSNEFNHSLTRILCGSDMSTEHTYFKALMAFALGVDSRLLLEMLGRAIATCEMYSGDNENVAEASGLFTSVMAIILAPTNEHAAVAAIDDIKFDDSFAAVFMDLLLIGS